MHPSPPARAYHIMVQRVGPSPLSRCQQGTPTSTRHTPRHPNERVEQGGGGRGLPVGTFRHLRWDALRSQRVTSSESQGWLVVLQEGPGGAVVTSATHPAHLPGPNPATPIISTGNRHRWFPVWTCACGQIFEMQLKRLTCGRRSGQKLLGPWW